MFSDMVLAIGGTIATVVVDLSFDVRLLPFHGKQPNPHLHVGCFECHLNVNADIRYGSK